MYTLFKIIYMILPDAYNWQNIQNILKHPRFK